LNAKELAVDFCKYRGENFKKIGFYAKGFKILIDNYGEDYVTFVYKIVKKKAENFYSPRYLQYQINNKEIKAAYKKQVQRELEELLDVKREVKEKQEERETRYEQTSQNIIKADLSQFKE